jgi:hypothetical protein
MEGIEMEDWARGGKVREKWEKYLRNEPKQSRKKKTTKAQRPSSPALNKRTGSDA